MNKDDVFDLIMTYGWAFLVVLVMLGALAYFGMLSPDYKPKPVVLHTLSFGDLNCKEIGTYICGIRCITEDKRYECLTDVWYEIGS